MSNSNLAFLLDSLKFLGFGIKGALQDQLKEMISRNEKDFICSAAYDHDGIVRMETDLHFRRGEKSDLYFFNKYDARLIYADDSHLDRSQTFYISKGRGVTRKEAFNLLQGRAVNKKLFKRDGSSYIAWIQLNFGERTPNGKNYAVFSFGERYGFDLEEVLKRFHIREMDIEPLRTALILSLKKGNVHPVTFSKDAAQTMLIEANPRFKTIDVYHQLPNGKIVLGGDPADQEIIPADQEAGEGPCWDDPDPEDEIAEEKSTAFPPQPPARQKRIVKNRVG